MTSSLRRAASGVGVLLLAGCALGGCASDDGAADSRLDVVAAFYPLQFVAERVVGSDGEVTTLTSPGVEPHDLELTPQAVAAVARADLVVHLAGFQPAVDDAVAAEAQGSAYDAAEDAELQGDDPHVWLDPVRLAAVGDGLAGRLGELDATHARAYRDRAAELRADLEALDAELAAGLASCTNGTLVTSHDAFGYLADRYGMDQVAIAGIDPEVEPSPADLAEVTAFVEEHDVRTVYSETLVSPEVAQVVADETGARLAVLDPLEGLTDDSAGADYLEVMRSNLQVLREGQPCP